MAVDLLIDISLTFAIYRVERWISDGSSSALFSLLQEPVGVYPNRKTAPCCSGMFRRLQWTMMQSNMTNILH